jgi:hypothetical protein
MDVGELMWIKTGGLMKLKDETRMMVYDYYSIS